MRITLIAPLALAAGMLVSTVASAETMAYPTTAKPSFLIDYPADWEMTPGEAEGDYTTLMGPAGATLMFRTIEGTSEAIVDAVEASTDYLKETYTNVKLSEPVDSVQKGLEGFYATGSGNDEDGPVVFAMAWYVLKDGTIGEIWYVATKDDTDGSKAASKVLDSFRAP